MREEKEAFPLYFYLLYALTYMCNAIYGNFVPVYLNQIGYRQTAIGLLLALAPFIAFIAQPVWGLAGDRSKTKNTVLKILLLGSAGAVALYRLSTGFYYLLVVMAIFAFFQTSVNPVSDAITLEYLETRRWRFGPIRMVGTVGYALMAVLAGTLANRNINGIFLLYVATALLAYLVTLPLPGVKGHQSEGNRIPAWMIFQNTELVLLMAFNFIIQVTVGFFQSFFPIYYRHMGADNGLVGWAMFIAAMSEVPFLLFAHRILRRLGTHRTLVLAGWITGIRWLLVYLIRDPYLMLAVQVLHGSVFIVFSYSLATYINEKVPRELKATGQTLNGLIGLGIGRIIANMAGGFLSDAVGIRPIFFYTTLLTFGSAVLFGGIFLWMALKKGRDPINTL